MPHYSLHQVEKRKGIRIARGKEKEKKKNKEKQKKGLTAHHSPHLQHGPTNLTNHRLAPNPLMRIRHTRKSQKPQALPEIPHNQQQHQVPPEIPPHHVEPVDCACCGENAEDGCAAGQESDGVAVLRGHPG